MKTFPAVVLVIASATFLQPISPGLAKNANLTKLAYVAPAKQEAAQIFDLLNNRLSLMSAVSSAKWKNGGAIEDLPREKTVIANARRNASRAGLRNVDNLTRTQIEMAKAIQRHWHRRWASEGLPANQTAIPLAQVRKQLEKIDAQILLIFPAALPALQDAQQEADLRRLFLRRVKAGAFYDAERELLFQAVLQVKSAK